MKLGNRLKQLYSKVTAEYEHIQECCCDHGLLGASFLERQAAMQTIHFVDTGRVRTRNRLLRLITTLIKSIVHYQRKQVANAAGSSDIMKLISQC